MTNALGQTTERREYAGPKPMGTQFTTTRYTYTAAGQQSTITGPDQAKWSYEYDLFGRQTAAVDPDKGRTTTQYNALDQVTKTTNANSSNNTLLYEYDDLGRKTGMWQTDKTDANKLAAWTFDTLAKGQLDTAVRYEGGATGKAYAQKVTAYDSVYRVTGSQLALPDTEPLVTAGVPKTLSFTTGYNLDGSVSQAGAPAVAGLAAETVSYTYNAVGGQLTSKGTTGYLQGAAFSPQGDLRQLTLGTDGSSSAKKAYLTWSYEEGTRRLTRAQTTDDVHSYPLQDLNFTQDDAGNVTSIFDTTTQGGTAKTDSQCFAYDGYSRLTEAWTPKTADCAAVGRAMSNIDGAAPYWTSYTYTDGGQRKTETQHTTSGDKTTTYTYDDPSDTKPHTLDKTTGARVGTYAYDNSGNTTSRPGSSAQQALAWNAEGDLAKLTESTKETSYLYDANGELLIRRARGDGDTVLYLGGGTEVRLTIKGTTKTLSGTRYYSANGQTIAVRTAVVGTSGSKLNFLAADQHGTSNVSLESGTYALTKRYSTPFGAPRGTKPAAWPDDKVFLGKPADGNTGLTHIGAREYDPATGQFLSVDPVLAADAPQSLNGYSYADNTPVTSSDPTGLCASMDCPTRPGPDYENTTPGHVPGTPRKSANETAAENHESYNGGTASTDSSGNTATSGGPYYACSGLGPAEVCKPQAGPVDEKENTGTPHFPDTGWYGPQPEFSFRELLRQLIEGPVCNPGYPCENGLIGVVPLAPEGPLGGRPVPGPRKMPMGFPNAAEYEAFRSQLARGLEQAGYEDVTPVMHGSSVTGRSFKSGQPFGPHSDFDIALASSDLLGRAKKAGVELRSGGTRTAPLEPADLSALGLRELSKSLSRQAGGRQVHFMIYGRIEDAVTRSPSIIMKP